MTKRPTSISVISWIFIVSGGLSLITTTAMINNPTVRDAMAQSLMPIPVQFAMIYLQLLGTIVSGVAMRRGKNWARYLYVICSLFGYVFALATSPITAALLPSFVFFLIAIFFLFRPSATAFFVSRAETANA